MSVISKVLGKMKSDVSTNESSSLVSICPIRDGDNGVKWWLFLVPRIVFPSVNRSWRFLTFLSYGFFDDTKSPYWWQLLLAKSKHWFIIKYLIVQRSLQTVFCFMTFHFTTNSVTWWFAMTGGKKNYSASIPKLFLWQHSTGFQSFDNFCTVSHKHQRNKLSCWYVVVFLRFVFHKTCVMSFVIRNEAGRKILQMNFCITIIYD